MSIVIDLKSEVKQSADLHLLEGILGALLGQRCLKVELSYGEELMVHLGDPVPCSSPELADETKGSWILGARASRWTLLLHDPPVLIASNGQPFADAESAGHQETLPLEVEKRAEPLIGCNIVTAKAKCIFPEIPGCGGIALLLEFNDGSHLTVLPDDEADDDETPLADWELFTPYDMYLACGPGPVWSYARSDVLKSV
ncbi:MAG TPA: hypothetical protein DDY78_10850 [Planctomycetales bacterium]|jgi:hypothetical protein|nr:hypothetical protein [Planctomycetales bacterium]